MADHLDPDAGLVEVDQILADEPLEQAHQILDLLERAAPVLGGERVDSQVVQREFDGRADRAAQRFEPTAMAFQTRQDRDLPPSGRFHP